MSNRLATALWATATVVAFLPVTPAPAAGQGQTAASTPPRTGWGQPDLRGMWDFRTLTPLQRPGRMADKEFLTDEEAALFVQRTLQERDKDRRYERMPGWTSSSPTTSSGGITAPRLPTTSGPP